MELQPKSNPPVSRGSFWRSWWREPLLHFVLAGALVFILFDLTGDEPAVDTPQIHITPALERQLKEDFQAKHGRPPSESEHQNALADWVESRALFLEARRRGLLDGDEEVRRFVAGRMRRIIERQLNIPEVSESDLRAFHRNNKQLFHREAVFSFDHVLASKERPRSSERASQFLAELQSGTHFKQLGDPFLHGRRLRNKGLGFVQTYFGEAFAEQLENATRGEWFVVSSKSGVHVVRLHAFQPGFDPKFEEVRLLVKQRHQDASKQALFEQALKEMVAKYPVRRETDSPDPVKP